MKGEQADYVIPLDKAFYFPPKKRITKALAVVKAFVAKHTRHKDTMISMEVNEFLHLHSKNIPKKIDATLLKEGGKIIVFLKGGKGLEEHRKKEAEKKKKDKKEEKKAKEEPKKDKEAEEEKRQKLEDKKEKEEAEKAAGIKRKTA